MQTQMSNLFKKSEKKRVKEENLDQLVKKRTVLELERWILKRYNLEEVEYIISDKKYFIPNKVDSDIRNMLFTNINIDNNLYKKRHERVYQDINALTALKRSDTYSNITNTYANSLNNLKYQLKSKITFTKYNTPQRADTRIDNNSNQSTPRRTRNQNQYFG